MIDLRKAAEMALEALEDSMYPQKKQFDAIVGLKQALNVDAIDTSSTYVDENEKREHEGCAECGVKASEGYALYCVKCTELFTQPEQEPVAWKEINTSFCSTNKDWCDDDEPIPLYTAPPSKPWVSLTDEEIDYIWGVTPPDYENFFEFPRAIEAALRKKNDPTAN